MLKPFARAFTLESNVIESGNVSASNHLTTNFQFFAPDQVLIDLIEESRIE